MARRLSCGLASAIAWVIASGCGGPQQAESGDIPEPTALCGGFEIVIGSADQPPPDEDDTRTIMLELEVTQTRRAGTRLAPPPVVFSRELMAWRTEELFHLIPSVRFEWTDAHHPCGEEFSIAVAALDEADEYVPVAELSVRLDPPARQMVAVSGANWSTSRGGDELCAAGQGLELLFRPIIVQ